MSVSQAYTSKVMNRNGYVIELPNVGSMEELMQTLPPNPYAESAIQLFPLGTKLIQGERVWRYCKNGAGTPGAGCALQQAIVQNAAACRDIVVDATTAIGAYTISLTSQAAIAVVANYYKEGYAIPNVGGGLGHAYKIKKHDALVGVETGKIFTLYDPLVIASTAGSTKWGLRKNPYDAVIAAAAVLTGIPVGVAPKLLTASCYFWAQTGGPAPCIVKAALATGAGVIVGSSAGKINPGVADESALQRIGFAMMTATTDGECGLIFLTLDR